MNKGVVLAAALLVTAVFAFALQSDHWFCYADGDTCVCVKNESGGNATCLEDAVPPTYLTMGFDNETLPVCLAEATCLNGVARCWGSNECIAMEEKVFCDSALYLC